MLFFSNISFKFNNEKNFSTLNSDKIYTKKGMRYINKKNWFTCKISPSIFLTPGTKKFFKLKTDENIQNIINSLQKVSDEKNFFEFCVCNREHLSYCLLYRLTALKLRTEGDVSVKNQSKNIDNFRKKILENNMYIDQAISQSFILSEKRIKNILENFREEDILKNIGENSTSVCAFWIVLNSALAAWEKKGVNDNENKKNGVYDKLKNINTVFLASEKHQSLLAHEMIFYQNSINSGHQKSQSIYSEKEMIEGLMLLILQLEKLPSNSYGTLHKKIIKFCEKILEKNLGSNMENLTNFKISVPLTEVENNSRLVEIQNNNL